MTADDGAGAHLAALLAAGERAVLHGAPRAAVSSLEQAVAVARDTGRGAELAGAAWLLGLALAATGRYAGALTVLGPLVDAGSRPEAPADRRLFGALAGSTGASVQRQLGRHAAARDADRRALTLAGRAGEAAVAARLGLAADALGLGDPAAAGAELAAADRLLTGAPAGSWRERVRADVVRAEVALAVGDADGAAAAAGAAASAAEAAEAPHARAEALLVAGAALAAGGLVEPAAAALGEVAALARALGTPPLAWRARALLGALRGSAADLDEARALVTGLADDLPPDLRAAFTARPDVAGLLAAG